MVSCAKGELFKVFTWWVMVEITGCIVGYLPNLKEEIKAKCSKGINNSKGKRMLIRLSKP